MTHTRHFEIELCFLGQKTTFLKETFFYAPIYNLKNAEMWRWGKMTYVHIFYSLNQQCRVMVS